MKTTIDANGHLLIEAETPIESYALKKWWTDFAAFIPLNGRDCPATMGVIWENVE